MALKTMSVDKLRDLSSKVEAAKQPKETRKSRKAQK
jgi:hypothetical protein